MVKKFFYMTLLAGVLFGCSNDDDGSIRPKERKNIELSRSEQVMAEETTDFAFRFFQKVNASETEQNNWMVSPLSASMALGMITNGAAGNTLAEMKAALGFSEANVDEMNDYYRHLLSELPDLDNTTQLGLANSIWVNQGFGVKTPFVDVNKQMYDAKVGDLDFSSAKASSTINGWCSDKTNGHISKVVEDISPSTDMILLNALYFKGIWQENYKFDKAKTQDEDFTNADGSVARVKMMNQTNGYAFSYNDHFWMARFGYGNNAYRMIVLLPDANHTLEECLEAMNAENWKTWNQNWDLRTLVVKMPRFEIEYNKDLIEDMKAMGIKDAFTSSADFAHISDNPLVLGKFDQYTYLKVDEEGTEAATVTKGETIPSSPLSPPPSIGPVEFYLNRPFAFVITETSTGTVLFMGKVTKF